MKKTTKEKMQKVNWAAFWIFMTLIAGLTGLAMLEALAKFIGLD